MSSSISAWADTYGNNGATNLSVPGSWIDETGTGSVPGLNDIAAWDSHDANAAATTFVLGADTTWKGILVTNPTAAVIIDNGANNLRLGSSGVDMSNATQNLTLSPFELFLNASQNWNVAANRTLTVTAISGGVDLGASNVLTLQGSGTTTIAATLTDSGKLAISASNFVANVSALGTVNLSGNNSFSGGVTLNSGLLNFTNAGRSAPVI